MGIPSYYKKLQHSIPGLLQGYSQSVTWLFMDFNCLIYYCIPHVEIFMTCKEYKASSLVDATDIYEDALIQLVILHLTDVVREIGGPHNNVFIAIDGVVPMAKMRQQRLRRFKSVWEKEYKKENTRWDTNAITPGTVFMQKLSHALQMVCDRYKWTLSSEMVPGEGEHKIQAELRTGKYKGEDIVIYGMDADLIVLSLLSQTLYDLGNVWTCREVAHSAPVVIPVESSAIPINHRGPIFEWLSIHLLKQWLLEQLHQTDPSFILTYCFAMSVLGNDFLPSSLGLKMHDGGHDELIKQLTILVTPLIDGAYQILYENLFELFRLLSQFEPHRIATYIKGKQRMANHCSEKGLGENNWPLAHIEEGLIGPMWSTNYWKQMDASVEDACQEYLTGIRWIWAYYTGKPVCFNWFYPYSLPPLWLNLGQMGLTLYQTGQDNRGNYSSLQSELPIKMRAQEIQPVEQLCLVLPLSSWSLIPACPQKKFPMLAPQFFPSSFTFESVGNRMFWQCHPCIPTPTPLELKAVLSS